MYAPHLDLISEEQVSYADSIRKTVSDVKTVLQTKETGEMSPFSLPDFENVHSAFRSDVLLSTLKLNIPQTGRCQIITNQSHHQIRTKKKALV